MDLLFFIALKPVRNTVVDLDIGVYEWVSLFKLFVIQLTKIAKVVCTNESVAVKILVYVCEQNSLAVGMLKSGLVCLCTANTKGVFRF